MSRNVILVALAGLLMLGAGCTHEQSPPATDSSTHNPADNQLTFDSPDEAVGALITGISTQDMPQLQRILGPEGDDVLDSGDDVADRQVGKKFVEAYNQKHQLVTNADSSVTLDVGDDAWPLPIPLVKNSSGRWYFDTPAGENEIVNRRIGRNELDVIQVCKAICDAQQDYAQQGDSQYAWKLISDPGKKNGLYWPTAPGERPSPLGELVAKATAEGYAIDPAHRDQPHPYHGYIYRLLTSQGANAPGGEVDYVINGKLVGGFALIAWPADYGNSGIMTFMTDYKGDVYQKDLGDETDQQARAIQSFDPDPTWKKAE